MNSETYKSQFNVLSNFLKNKRGIKVRLTPTGDEAWYPRLKLIQINKNLHWRERFFTLLHEAGHAINDTDFQKKKKMCFNDERPQNIRSKNDYVHTLNDEFLAWNTGKEIADSFHFELDYTQYDEYMTDCIMTYIKTGLQSVYGSNIDVYSIRSKYV